MYGLAARGVNELATLAARLRSFALRLRGLRSSSSAVGRIGFFVRTSSRWSLRKASLTRRSSSEWKLMIASRPPGFSRSGIRCQGQLQRFQLAIHGDPQGLKRPRGRVEPVGRARHAAADELGQVGGRLDRPLAACSTIRRAIRRLSRSSPNSIDQVGQLLLRQAGQQLPGRLAFLGIEPQVERAARRRS